jgi:uncharacterized MAPEG superfamily protein
MEVHMSPDLFWLACTALLSLAIPVIYLTGRVQTPDGVRWAFGNRDTTLAVPAWAARAERAHANLTENLAPFAALVLVASLAGKSGSLTATGAAMFFWARVAHVLVYTAGIVGLRTVVFFVGAVGEILIAIALFR